MLKQANPRKKFEVQYITVKLGNKYMSKRVTAARNF